MIDDRGAQAARARQYLLLAVGTAVTLSFGLHAVAPALPLIQLEFALSDFQVGLVTSAYVLPGVAFAVPLGIAADLFGRRRVFALSGILYGAMGVAQGLAPTFGWLLVWRLGQGVAFAALMPLTITVIGDAFSGLGQVRAQARRQISMAMATLVVPVVGAQLAVLTWSLPFIAQSVTVLPGLLALVVLDKNTSTSAARKGYLRLALRSIRQPGFPSVLAVGFVRFVARFSILAYLPLHLARELEASLTEVGVVMGIATGLGFASAMAAARLSTRWRPSWVTVGALVVCGLGLVGFALSPTLAWAIPVATVFALGDGLIAVLQSSYAARGTAEGVRAGVVAVNGTARNAGKFVGPLFIGAIAALIGIPGALALAGVVVAGAALLVHPGLALFDDVLQDTEAAVER
ncbi:MAG TPA: MFS transporter [Acidimicrobiia bacterium]|nr:MFS transporter [Acidimicrobiia bacterium]